MQTSITTPSLALVKRKASWKAGAPVPGGEHAGRERVRRDPQRRHSAPLDLTQSYFYTNALPMLIINTAPTTPVPRSDTAPAPFGSGDTARRPLLSCPRSRGSREPSGAGADGVRRSSPRHLPYCWAVLRAPSVPAKETAPPLPSTPKLV